MRPTGPEQQRRWVRGIEYEWAHSDASLCKMYPVKRWCTILIAAVTVGSLRLYYELLMQIQKLGFGAIFYRSLMKITSSKSEKMNLFE
jgi:hypothetical protein